MSKSKEERISAAAVWQGMTQSEFKNTPCKRRTQVECKYGCIKAGQKEKDKGWFREKASRYTKYFYNFDEMFMDVVIN